jgi:putative transposase
MSETRKTFEGKLYYVTLTVVGWIDIFTRKEYVYEVLDNLKLCQERKGLEIYAYVIMSNHVHLIARTNNGRLNDLLGSFKSFTAKKLIGMVENNQQESRQEWLMHMFKYFGKGNPQNKEFQFWQNGNHPIELYSPKVIKQKIKYLHNNPVKQGIVARPEDYLYSSANEFSYLKILSV